LFSRLKSKNVKIKTYRTIILPVVLYGRETWSSMLMKEYRLRAFENRVLRKIFGFKRVEVVRGWRKLNNEELNSLFSSPNIITVVKSRMMRCVGHVSRMGEMRKAYKILIGKSEGKRPSRRPRCRQGDILKWILGKLGFGVWIGFIWLRIGTSGGLL
jgi:hypothetical protein